MIMKKFPAPYELKIQFMCPNLADSYEMHGAERIDHQTIILRGNDFIDVLAQLRGWTAGVHNKKFNINPRSVV
jgi:hypothetical protein